MGPWRTHGDVETMYERRSIQRTSGKHFWRKGTWTWSLVPLLPRKRHPSVDVTYQNYAQALWQPLMKETRFALSMMDPGEVRMHTSRLIQKNALRPLQSWTASTAFTGCRRHRRNRVTRSSPTHTGIGPNRKQDDQWMLLKADATKAHRRVKILSPEWRYQVAKLGDEWWINKVGTYGMASAPLYWGRLASALLRLLYHVYPMVDWGFVFVDDFCWLLRKSLAGPLTSAILLFLVAFGCPLSWGEDSYWPFQHLVGVHYDPRPTVGPDGAYQTRVGHCSVGQDD